MVSLSIMKSEKNRKCTLRQEITRLGVYFLDSSVKETPLLKD